MSTRGELNTLVRLVPEITTSVISDTNLNLLFTKAQVDIAVRGRALTKNLKFNSVANQQEYILSGASPVITDNDFLAVDLKGGGFLYSDGTNWNGSSREGFSDGKFEPKTKEWLDKNYPSWRTNSGTTTPLFWYIDLDSSGNLVIGIVDKPSASSSNIYWLNYLARGKLMTDDTHYPWTDTTSQLVHLEPYEMLFVWWALAYINRVLLHTDIEAALYTQLYEAGLLAMANRFPLFEHLAREGFQVPNYFRSIQTIGRRM